MTSDRKKGVPHTLIPIAVVCVYMAFSFGCATFDISAWHDLNRLMCAFGMGASAVSVLMLNYLDGVYQ